MSGEYLVHHGCAGHLGRFQAAEGGYDRGAAVVVRSRRGVEMGEVLCPSVANPAAFPDDVVGDLLRAATTDDFAAAERQREIGSRVFDDGSQRAAQHDLPLALLDVEVFLDGRQALLHAVRLGPCDLNPFLADLGDRHGMIVRIYDLHAEPTVDDEEHGCGSCGESGCGEGGCSTGGCGSCSSGAANELANYFADLRAQMDQRRVALL